MTDFRYSQELINKWKNEHVPVRVLLDTRADASYPATANIRSQLAAAGIPIRNYHGPAINHWKMMLFAGQKKVEFSAANYADGSYSPAPLTGSYVQYVDEAIYFTDDVGIVQSFMKRYDDNWVDIKTFSNYANITGPLVRTYPIYPIVPEMNFVPDQKYDARLINLIGLETQKIDVVMFRITASNIPDALIARWQAGVPVRLITEEEQYRTPKYLWDSYNVDRMYAAGIPIKVKDNVTQQDVHQKSIILYGGGKAVFGSSNWTDLSQTTEMDHNYFATNSAAAGSRAKPWILDWFKAQFERKWNNTKEDGTPILNADGTPRAVFIDFVPLPPETPVIVSPANDALGQPSTVTLKWEGGNWAHKYDVYLDTTPTFTSPIIVDYMPGAATAGVVSAKESQTVSGLLPATTYYWKIVSKTMANMTKAGPVWHFTTAGSVPPPPAPTGLIAPSISRTRLTLQWNDVVGEEGYKIERKLASAPATAWVQIGTTAADVATYSDTNSALRANTAYNYRVRAFTTGGNSDYSNELAVTTAAIALSQRDVVLYANEATVRVGSGKWTTPADATAAGGRNLTNANAGAATVTTPAANPGIYFEMTFNAAANVPYRLWIRGKALNDNQFNDSMWVQFNDSVNASSAAIYRIGTSSATQVNIEDCSGCLLKAWGWQDNGQGKGVLGPTITFANTGLHTIRVQPREDGFSIDQIVLSPDTFLTEAPGELKSDTLILPEQNNPVGSSDTTAPTVTITDPLDGETVQGSVTVSATATDNVGVNRVEFNVDGALAQTDTVAPYEFTWNAGAVADGAHTIQAVAYDSTGNKSAPSAVTVTVSNPATLSKDVVLYTADVLPANIHGSWALVADATAAGGKRIHQPNAGAAKINAALASPTHYFDMTFNAEAGIGYRIWLRGKADGNNFANDSVFAQFSGSLTQAGGAATYRIGSTSGTAINLEDCNNCGDSGWGWQDNGWGGVGVLGPLIYFATSGQHTIRIQAREDGFSIDQIVLSPATYVDSPPGPQKNDTTILPRQ